MPRIKRTSPGTKFPIETVYWHDADGPSDDDRGKIDFEPTLLTTTGFLIHEDEHLVVLVMELDAKDRWIDSENNEWRKIPKGTIISRQRHQDAQSIYPPEEKGGDDGKLDSRTE